MTVRTRLLPAKVVDWFARPSSVWWGFAVVHLYFLGWMASFFLNGDTFSDTEQYRQWALDGYNPADLTGKISPWVYPVLAQIPIFLANTAGPGLYLLVWFLIITALNAVGLVYLTRGPRKVTGIAPAWWWLFFTVFMGYLSFARVEGITAPIVLIALLYAAERPVVAGVLLSIATWIKVWPAAVLVPIVIASHKRIQVVLAGAAVTAVVGLGTWLTGGLPHIMDFLLNQGERGMQLEATFSTPWVWLSVFHIAGSRMADNTAINSTEVYGPGAGTAAFLMQPLLVLAAVTAAILLVRALRRGAEREELFLEGALMMVTAFIVFNKVGSPQFIIWLAPVIIAGLAHDWERWKVPAALMMGIAMTTFVIYPLFYTPLIHAHPVMAAILTTRNVLLVVLLWWSVKRTAELGRKTSAQVPAGA
ncbi:glycosyltransferase 87 family protein [Arthrobacter sp. FX8]|uniref:glycosyltransferase 87 family protein n=1 Tax=unclassified Arthrobacter TaxID=235627 RepID=UPI00037F306A|nr:MULTISPECIES: glycosyltransferase 87 family protein [unclassified Arthrobacter]WAJ32882.1 glycosyltransferase 87 family protein [Arthrobacter sp. FX8]BCW52698.1 membrane protein [Arthrobacter sp. StoSoilB19]